MKAEIIFKTPKDSHFFFGYFGKIQLNKSNSKLLALKVHDIDNVPSTENFADIGFFDLSNNKFTIIDKTNTFNWQQGCMLEWLGPDFNSKIIYNKRKDDKIISIIYDLNKKSFEEIECSIYSVASNGKFALTIDYERHHWFRRGYSYDFEFPNKEKDKPLIINDGISKVCFDTKEIIKIITIQQVLMIKPLSSMDGAVHYLEHMSINPSSKTFCFLHRWRITDGGIYARFYIADHDGKNIKLVLDSGRMSHFSWKNNHEIIAYGGVPTSLNKLRKNKNIAKFFIKPLLPLYHFLVKDTSKLSKKITGDSYLILNIKDKSIKKVASDISNKDGHPSFSILNESVFVTDTYPLKENNNIAELIVYDLQQQKYFVLDKLRSINKYDFSPIRCDLHPRWSIDGNFISVDTMDQGCRSIYLYKIIK